MMGIILHSAFVGVKDAGKGRSSKSPSEKKAGELKGLIGNHFKSRLLLAIGYQNSHIYDAGFWNFTYNYLKLLARPAWLERATCGFEDLTKPFPSIP